MTTEQRPEPMTASTHRRWIARVLSSPTVTPSSPHRLTAPSVGHSPSPTRTATRSLSTTAPDRFLWHVAVHGFAVLHLAGTGGRACSPLLPLARIVHRTASCPSPGI